MCSVYILKHVSKQKIQPNVGQSGGAWKTLSKASVSLIVQKRKDSCFFVLPIFGDSEAMYNSHVPSWYRLKTFIMWDLLDKIILKVRVAILST